jgi:hypothetical protein
MNCRGLRSRAVPLFFLTAVVSLAIPSSILAQGAQPAARPAAPPPTPEQVAPIDLTGYWVSVVTEDWRFRMMVPDKGDYASMPLNAEGRRVADTWAPGIDRAPDTQCKAFGAAGLMRIPGRLHISWENPTTLKIETDSGTQTRLLHFEGSAPASLAPQWQGYSVADWEGMRPRARGAPAGPSEGYLKVLTGHMRAGYLRTNGVPYSANAALEEYFDTFKERNGDVWLIVTTIVTDPQYLMQPFITSTHFKKLADSSGWDPTPCRADEPR